MSWRPPNWEEIKIKACIHRQGIPEANIEPAGCETCPTNIRECQGNLEYGADAMLEALFELEKNPDVKFLTFVKMTGGYIDVVCYPRGKE